MSGQTLGSHSTRNSHLLDTSLHSPPANLGWKIISSVNLFLSTLNKIMTPTSTYFSPWHLLPSNIPSVLSPYLVYDSSPLNKIKASWGQRFLPVFFTSVSSVPKQCWHETEVKERFVLYPLGLLAGWIIKFT